jgi:menaquinone-dependent protoporphyrinogen oxidase
MMEGRILVAFASRTGTTHDIAEAVGRELRSAGASVDIAELKEVASVEGYAAVVIGSPIYMGRIEGDVGKFVARHRDALAKLPVAAFAVGLPSDQKGSTKEDGAEKIRAALDPLKPVAATMFAGRLDTARLSFVQRTMVGFVKAPTGDFRDWDEIAAWAKGLPALCHG